MLACQQAYGGITYSATSGIWQTVWLEAVPDSYITRVDSIPSIDSNSVTVTVHGSNNTNARVVAVVAKDGDAIVGSGVGLIDGPINVPVPSPKLWTPDTPNLYNLTVSLLSKNVSIENLPQFGNEGLFEAPEIDEADVEDKVCIMSSLPAC